MKPKSVVLYPNENGRTVGGEGFQEVYSPVGWECDHANKSLKPPEYEGHIILCKQCKAAYDAGASLKDKDGLDIDVTGDITVEETHEETHPKPEARRPMKGRGSKPTKGKGRGKIVIRAKSGATRFKTRLNKKKTKKTGAKKRTKR